jgi:hypothetical protein
MNSGLELGEGNVLYLSKRNLLVLLSKLERLEKGEETNCAIVKYADYLDPYSMNGMDSCKVVAVPDEYYYVGREPGVMHEKDTPNE